MTCRTAVVKLGGGVITDKSTPGRVDYENLEEIALQLAEYRRSGGLLVVVHGGGSFGHVEVARISREKGHLDSRDSSRVQTVMLELAVTVLKVLEEKGLNPTLHPPHTLCRSSLPETCDISVIKRDLEEGLTPVIYGDAIPEKEETKIISGDDLAARIAVELKADCLVYIIREPGVLDEKGEVIPILTSLNQLKVKQTKWNDVTGGITRKIKTALEASKTVNNTIITNTEHLLEALRGKQVGTRVAHN